MENGGRWGGVDGIMWWGPFSVGGGVTPCPSLCLLVVGGDWERASGQLATPVDPRDPEI